MVLVAVAEEVKSLLPGLGCQGGEINLAVMPSCPVRGGVMETLVLLVSKQGPSARVGCVAILPGLLVDVGMIPRSIFTKGMKPGSEAGIDSMRIQQADFSGGARRQRQVPTR